MGMANHRPLLFGAWAAFFLLITDFLRFSLHHISQIYRIFQYFAYGGCRPDAFRLPAAVFPLLRQGYGRGQYTANFQHLRHPRTGKSHEIEPENGCHHFRFWGARHQHMTVKGTFFITIRRIIPQILPHFPFPAQNCPNIIGQFLAIPFIDEAVDLAGPFILPSCRIHSIHHGHKPYPPQRKQLIKIPFCRHQISCKTGLSFTQNHRKPPFSAMGNELLKTGAIFPQSRIILIHIDACHLPAFLRRVSQKQFFLIGNAFAVFSLLSLCVLYRQSAINGCPLHISPPFCL